jgi:hypothetical protein
VEIDGVAALAVRREARPGVIMSVRERGVTAQIVGLPFRSPGDEQPS